MRLSKLQLAYAIRSLQVPLGALKEGRRALSWANQLHQANAREEAQAQGWVCYRQEGRDGPPLGAVLSKTF